MTTQDNKKITLLLNSRTYKKLIKEAENALSGIYPYKIEEDKIIIRKTDRKGYYDVYISETGNNNFHKNLIRLCLSVLIFILLIALCFLVIVSYNSHKEVIQDQKDTEKLLSEKLQLQEQKKEKLKQLKQKYEEYENLSYPKIYPYIQHIYSVLEGKATVENLTIEKDFFSIEVTTSDAVETLSRFERNNAFSSIKMNRTTVENNRETVIYNGIFSKVSDNYSLPDSIEDAISFYETKVNFYEEKTARINEIPLSEYIAIIRNTLHENGCMEQYIQLRGNDKSAEIEFLIVSSSRNILTFINEIQKEDDNLINIKSIKLHNSEEKNHIQTIICFDSGIGIEDNEIKLSEYKDIQLSPSEIDKIFYKKTSVNNTVKQTQIGKTIPSPTITSTKNIQTNIKPLSFIGITKINGKTFIMAKDTDMNVIYKLALNSSETDEDYCIETENGYKAKINNEYYEVKK
jgi:hypothetical protein